MAQCKDCIHEKVCLHKVNIQTDTYAYMGVKYDTEKCKHYTSADVVPKSEVESINPIQEAIEQKKKENKGFALGVLNELLDEKDAEIKRLEYTLTGVMHSVDKWLDGEELEQDEVNRAITMREKTLRIMENAKSDYEYLKKLLDDKCDRCIEEEKQRVARVAGEIFEELQSCLIQRHWNGLDIVSFEFDAVKYAELKKKYTESEDNE